MSSPSPNEALIRDRYRALVAQHGVSAVARTLGLTRHVVMSLSGAGKPHGGTLALGGIALERPAVLALTSLPVATAGTVAA